MRRTLHYNYPLFDASDKPSWLTDWNETVTKIDEKLFQIATASGDTSTLQQEIDALRDKLDAVIASIAPTFDASQTYHTNDMVYHNDELYLFTADYVADSGWDSAQVTQKNLAEVLSGLLNSGSPEAPIEGNYTFSEFVSRFCNYVGSTPSSIFDGTDYQDYLPMDGCYVLNPDKAGSLIEYKYYPASHIDDTTTPATVVEDSKRLECLADLILTNQTTLADNVESDDLLLIVSDPYIYLPNIIGTKMTDMPQPTLTAREFSGAEFALTFSNPIYDSTGDTYYGTTCNNKKKILTRKYNTYCGIFENHGDEKQSISVNKDWQDQSKYYASGLFVAGDLSLKYMFENGNPLAIELFPSCGYDSMVLENYDGTVEAPYQMDNWTHSDGSATEKKITRTFLIYKVKAEYKDLFVTH